MSTTAVTHQDVELSAVEKALVGGDLKDLKTEERLSYYNRVCESLGLNPLTQPFAYLQLSGKLTLYARKDAAEQLRQVRGISLKILSREMVDGMYVVTCEASTPQGRTDAATGVISLASLQGEAKANAMMKAETKAKRRVTLSICGLGLLDETEVDSVPGARKVSVQDAHSGRLLNSGAEPTPTPTPKASDDPRLQEILQKASVSQQESDYEMADICQSITELSGQKASEDAWRKALKRHGDPATKVGAIEPVIRELWAALEAAKFAGAVNS